MATRAGPLRLAVPCSLQALEAQRDELQARGELRAAAQVQQQLEAAKTQEEERRAEVGARRIAGQVART
jgi:hypothetical protein